MGGRRGTGGFGKEPGTPVAPGSEKEQSGCCWTEQIMPTGRQLHFSSCKTVDSYLLSSESVLTTHS